MGVIMGKIIMRDTENQTQLILQAGDEKSLIKQVEGIDMLERKAKAFDTFLLYNQHVEKYNNSDCHELERVFQRVMKEYMEVE